MMNSRCHACNHYVLQWSHVVNAYVEGCSSDKNCSQVQKEDIKKPIAVIKRR